MQRVYATWVISCNHQHEEEIEEDTIFAARGGEEDICQNTFSVRLICHHSDSSYLEFKGYSAVPD